MGHHTIDPAYRTETDAQRRNSKEVVEKIEILNLYQRLHAVMEDVSYIEREDKKVNNQYTFVSHDAVTAKVRKALVEHRVFAVPNVEEFTQDGNRTTADIKITFFNIDNPDEKLSIDCFGYGVDGQDKGPGKAVSYAVKYGLLKAFMLETGDDPERDNTDYKASDIKPVQRTRKPDPNAPMNKTELEIEYPRIKNLFENTETENEAHQVWSECCSLINRMPDRRIEILQDLRDRFEGINQDTEDFPSDMK